MKTISTITRLVRHEPVAFQGCVQATLAALVGFGVVHWSAEQVGLMLAVVAAFLALFTRSQVTPNVQVASKAQAMAEAQTTTATTDVGPPPQAETGRTLAGP